MARILQWRELDVASANIPDEGKTDGKVGCEPAKAIVYAGHGVTNSGGVWRVSLPAITCGAPDPSGRPSIVAMPTWDTDPTARIGPIVLVAQLAGTDISIYSYYSNTAAIAPNVPFSWHCVVELV